MATVYSMGSGEMLRALAFDLQLTVAALPVLIAPVQAPLQPSGSGVGRRGERVGMIEDAERRGVAVGERMEVSGGIAVPDDGVLVGGEVDRAFAEAHLRPAAGAQAVEEGGWETVRSQAIAKPFQRPVGTSR